MRESEFLSPPDVRVLANGATDAQAQSLVLTANGIPHRVVGKRVIVSREHARQWLAGRQVTPSARPNLAAAV